MADELLSQEEIDALLRGGAAENTDSRGSTDSAFLDLTDDEKDILGELANISMGSAATTLSTLLNKKVEITTPTVEERTIDSFEESFPEPSILFRINFIEGLDGMAVFVLKEKDALIIGDLMMGGDGVSNLPDSVNELYQSAVSEAMNQMMGAAATSMSSMIGRKVNIAPPDVKPFDLRQKADLFPELPLDQKVASICFKLSIEGITESNFCQIMPIDFAKKLCVQVKANMTSGEQPSEVVSAPETQPAPSPEPRPSVSAQTTTQQIPKKGTETVAQPVQFAPLPQAGVTQQIPNRNIDLILDVPVRVSVELGETKMLIRDILSMSPGSLVELNKLAGEPVDVLVNGKIIARGEVVVVDENFGVRITSIVTPQERIERMRKSLE